MLTTINAHLRMSGFLPLSEEDIQEMEYKATKIEITTYDGKCYSFERDDLEVVKHDFEDSNEDLITYKDNHVSVFHLDNSLHPELIDAVKINNIPHRVFCYGELLVLYNERDRKVVLECTSEEIVEKIKSIDSKCKIYKLTDGFL